MSGQGLAAGGGAGSAGARGCLAGRLAGRFAGAEVPAWVLVAVGGRASGLLGGVCSFVVTVPGSGPVRVHYSLEPAGPSWLRLVVVSERRRRRVLRAVLGCGVLEGAGPRAERAGQAAGAGSGGPVGVRAGVDAAGDVDGASPFGWLHAAVGNVTVWTDLPEDGRVGSVAVRELVVGLVPRGVWRELHARGLKALEVRRREIEALMDETLPDSYTDSGSGWGPGLDSSPDSGPDGGPDGGGWPGIRRGGGLGGVVSPRRYHGIQAPGRVGLPPVVQRPDLPVRARLTVGSALLLWVVRPAWLWRRELGALVVLGLVAAAGWLLRGWLDVVGLVGWRAGWSGAVEACVLVVGAVAGVPWSRRWVARSWRRARLRRHWDRAMRFAGLTTVNDRVPRIRRDRRVPAGVRLLVRVPRGATVDDLAAESERVAAVLQVREIRVGRDVDRADLAHVDIVQRDPFMAGGVAARPMAWPWADGGQRSLADPVPLGVDDMGDRVAVRLPGKHFLLGGEPESGKSTALSLLLAAAALDPSAQVWGWDAKRVELALWRPVMTRIVFEDMDAAIKQQEDLITEMEARYAVLERSGRRVLRPGEAPVILAATDELRFFTANPDRAAARRFNALGLDVAARGRAALIVQACATQKPSGDVVPTGWRDLMALRWAMRCTTRDASDTILGAGMATAGFDASGVDLRTRGVGLLYAEGGLPRRVRSYYLDDHEIRSVVAQGAALRRPSTGHGWL